MNQASASDCSASIFNGLAMSGSVITCGRNTLGTKTLHLVADTVKNAPVSEASISRGGCNSCHRVKYRIRNHTWSSRRVSYEGGLRSLMAEFITVFMNSKFDGKPMCKRASGRPASQVIRQRAVLSDCGLRSILS